MIAYANEVKIGVLGVDADVLDRHGAVSEEVAAAMAEGARRADRRDLRALDDGRRRTGRRHAPTSRSGSSTSPAPGPAAAAPSRERFPGDRHSVRAWAVARALHLLRETLGR